MSDKLISVIIPAFNREKYIGEAIESILSQAEHRLELIVVDDGSTDQTSEIVKSYGSRLTYVYQTNKGVGAARNLGISHATGNYFAFLDSDDVWVSNKLLNQLSVLDAMPHLDAVFGQAKQFFSPETSETFRKRIDLSRAVLPCQTPSALLIRRSPFEQVGPFDESMRIGCEIDWYARFVECGLQSLMLPEVVVYRRVHESNSTFTNEDSNKDRLKVLKRMLDRRREIV